MPDRVEEGVIPWQKKFRMGENVRLRKQAIIPATLYVGMDEPAYMLIEQDLLTPDGKQWHRFQVITVIREDGLHEYF